jgi:hypothetical protein
MMAGNPDARLACHLRQRAGRRPAGRRPIARFDGMNISHPATRQAGIEDPQCMYPHLKQPESQKEIIR